MKTGQDVITVCKNCSEKVPLGDMRYHPGYKDYVCAYCFGKKERPKKEVKLDLNKPRVNFVCKTCDYNFSKAIGSKFSGKCPFCGKEDIYQVQDRGQDLIKEVNNELFEDSKKL